MPPKEMHAVNESSLEFAQPHPGYFMIYFFMFPPRLDQRLDAMAISALPLPQTIQVNTTVS